MNRRITNFTSGFTDLFPPADRLKGRGLAGKAALALAVLLVIGLLLLGGLFAVGTFLFYNSYSSSYEYDGAIYVDGETEDAEFLVPLPVHNGEPHLGKVHFTESERFVGIEYAVVDTEHGPMLQIEVNEIREGPHWHSLWFSARVEVDEFIDNRNPMETNRFFHRWNSSNLILMRPSMIAGRTDVILMPAVLRILAMGE